MNQRQLDKNAALRLAVLRHAEEVTGNVALICRYYGITRQAFYQWRRRYEAGGLEALRTGPVYGVVMSASEAPSAFDRGCGCASLCGP